jgi:hypothetical protein
VSRVELDAASVGPQVRAAAREVASVLR